ncbi:MAG: type II toxin-antitoxin system VapC family toxin [Deltaproteobacteria bacterium]|nr:type II toxin-antitoxin system VapC family toxin [Deltaproteobacteria bacterium]
MIPFIVDSSVVFKWYRQPGDEDYVSQAVSILERHLHGKIEIHVPDLLFYELGNILRFKEGLVSKDGLTILKETFGLDLQIYPIDLPLAEDAYQVSREYKITFYDASFVALSRLLNASFITADKKLFEKIQPYPRVIFLGNV